MAINQDGEQPTHDWRRWAAGTVAFLVGAWLVRQYYGDFEAWLQGLGEWAPLVFIGVHAVSVTLMMPVSALGFLAGASFGVVKGTLILLLAGLVTASLMYWLGRGVLSERVLKYSAERPKLARFLKLVDHDSVRIMVLLRFSPLHFGVLNFLMGASRVRFLPYLATTCCLLPSALLQAYAGHTARVLGQQAMAGGEFDTWKLILAGTGLVVVIILTVVLGRLARKALEATDEEAT